MVNVPAPEQVMSTRSKRVTMARRLSTKNMRHSTGKTRIEGPQALREAMTYRRHAVTDIYITRAAAKRHPDILELYETVYGDQKPPHMCYLHWVSPEIADFISADAQGIIGIGTIGTLFSTIDVLSAVRRHNGFALVLSYTSDPGNMGTLIRVADATAAEGVIVCQGSVDYTSPKVIRMSVGSVFHLPIQFVDSYHDLVDYAHEEDVMVIGADGSGSLSLFKAKEHLEWHPHVWVMGNEAHGFRDGALEACDYVVSVPIYGKAESLNVAAAGAMCLYESARYREEIAE